MSGIGVFSSSNDYVHIVTPVLVNKTVKKKRKLGQIGGRQDSK
jgi:hypothetical protein